MDGSTNATIKNARLLNMHNNITIPTNTEYNVSNLTLTIPKGVWQVSCFLATTSINSDVTVVLGLTHGTANNYGGAWMQHGQTSQTAIRLNVTFPLNSTSDSYVVMPRIWHNVGSDRSFYCEISAVYIGE